MKRKPDKERNPRKETLDELMKKICALLNPAGVVIEINESQNEKTTVIGDRDELMRNLEQQLLAMMERSEYMDQISYLWEKEVEVYRIIVKKGKRMYTVNSGLKVPLHRSVVDANHQDIVNIFLSLVVGEEKSQCNYPDQRHAELSFDTTVPKPYSSSISYQLKKERLLHSKNSSKNIYRAMYPLLLITAAVIYILGLTTMERLRGWVWMRVREKK